MDIESYIEQAVFGENEQHTCFYRLMWDTFKESGFVITDEDGYEIDSILKATAIQNPLFFSAFLLPHRAFLQLSFWGICALSLLMLPFLSLWPHRISPFSRCITVAE